MIKKHFNSQSLRVQCSFGLNVSDTEMCNNLKDPFRQFLRPQTDKQTLWNNNVKMCIKTGGFKCT